MNSLPDISDCFEVIFLQEPRDQQKLDVLESMWINKLLASIKQFYQNTINFVYCFSGIFLLWSVVISYSRKTYFAWFYSNWYWFCYVIGSLHYNELFWFWSADLVGSMTCHQGWQYGTVRYVGTVRLNFCKLVLYAGTVRFLTGKGTVRWYGTPFFQRYGYGTLVRFFN